MSKATTRAKPTTKQRSKKPDAPWEHAPARPKKPKHLTSAQRGAAKRRAKAAGRQYPNLVDNMHEAASPATKKASAKKTSAKKTSAKKTSAKKTSARKKQEPKGRRTALEKSRSA